VGVPWCPPFFQLQFADSEGQAQFSGAGARGDPNHLVQGWLFAPFTLSVSGIEVVAQDMTGEVNGRYTEPASEHVGHDKQVFPLVLLGLSDITDRRLIKLTHAPRYSILANVNLRAGLVRAERHLDLVAGA
jgi:hypothetical protein